MQNSLNVSRKDRGFKVQILTSAILLFLCANPYFLWHTPLVSVALGLLCIVSFRYYSFKQEYFLLGTLFFIIYLTYVIKSEFSFWGAMSVILIVPFFFMKAGYVEVVYDKFIVVLAILLIPSILQYFLNTFIGIPFPYKIIPPYEELKPEMYHQYTFFVVNDQLRLLPRFFSYFDEPGVIGTLCGMILLSKKFNLSHWSSVVLLISGILSLSLAFFVFVAVGVLILDYKHKFWVVLGLISLVVVLSQIEYLEPFFMRFAFEDNQLIGDNRTTDSFNTWFANFMNSSDVWLGKGRGYAAYMNEGGSSYKNLIVDYGIIFFIFYILIFCFKAIKKIGLSREFFLWIALFGGCMYQRPSINRPEYVFVWLAAIYLLSNKEYTVSHKKEKMGRILKKTSQEL